MGWLVHLAANSCQPRKRPWVFCRRSIHADRHAVGLATGMSIQVDAHCDGRLIAGRGCVLDQKGCLRIPDSIQLQEVAKEGDLGLSFQLSHAVRRFPVRR